MGLNFGPQMNYGGTIPAGGKVRQDITNPRGKVSWARRLVVRNTGANSLTVTFPRDGNQSVPDVGFTVPSGGVSQDFEGLVPYFVITGTAGQTWEATATVAG